MIFARIINNKVQDCIRLDDPELIPVFSQDFDLFIQVDGRPDRPSPGHDYDSDADQFSPPPVAKSLDVAAEAKLGLGVAQKAVFELNSICKNLDTLAVSIFTQELASYIGLLNLGLYQDAANVISKLQDSQGILNQPNDPKDPKGKTNRAVLMGFI